MEARGEVDGLRHPRGHVDRTAQDEGVVLLDAVNILGALGLHIDVGGPEPLSNHRGHLIGGPMLGGRGQQDLHAA